MVFFLPRVQDFRTKDEATNSPLAQRLFRENGVTGIFFGPDFISVTKSESTEWQVLKPKIFSTIMDFYASGKAIVTEKQVNEYGINEDDSEVVAMIKELLDTRIRPSVQEDGGDIFFHEFREDTGVVVLRLAGSCSGCPSSSVTLKNGVENMLMHYIPEVTAIEEYVDEKGIEEFNEFDRKLQAAKKQDKDKSS
jgi:Fe-S cluster biogenesis protein NfuA